MEIKTNTKLEYLAETKGLIREAIEAKGQTVADTDTFRSYAAKINSIEVSAAPVLESLEATENGNYTPSAGTDGFSSVSVQVPDIPAVVQPLEVTENGTYTAPDGVDGYSPVTVNVDPTWKNILQKAEVNGFALDSNFGAFSPGYVYPATFTLEAGKTYRVHWDGEDRECVAFELPIYQDLQIVAIGNASSLGAGLPGNNEQFLITHNKTGNNTQLFSTDNKESHTVGIWERVAQEINLQDKTITENGTYTADSGYDGLGSVTVEVAGSGTSPDLRYVTFMSYDGTEEHGKKAVAVGDDCADPIERGIFEKPKQPANTPQYDYGAFLGWSDTLGGNVDINALKSITEDKIVYAVFEQTAILASGTCGGSVYWKLREDYTFDIYGEGPMSNYPSESAQPWYSYASVIKSATIEIGVTNIGSYAFQGCTNMQSVVISESVTNIGSYAFQGCTNLKNVTIPSSVRSISNYVFRECTNLLSAELGEGVTSTGFAMFYKCSKLQNVVIPDSVSNINDWTFGACSSLKNIVIPDGVTRIGQNSFYNTGLTSATFEVTNGWNYFESDTATSGTTISSTSLANKSTAATYLKSTYNTYWWKRT